MSTALYYPTKAAPTTTVTLPDARPLGIVAAPRFFTVQQVTDGGTRYAYEHGGPERMFDLNFILETAALFDALVGLIRDDTRGPLNTFEADVLGVSYTGCRFDNAAFEDLQTEYRDVGNCERFPVRLRFTSA